MFKGRSIDDWRKNNKYGNSDTLDLFSYIYNIEIWLFGHNYGHMTRISHRGIRVTEDTLDTNYVNDLPPPKRGYLILKDYHYWVIVPSNYKMPKLNLSIRRTKV